MWMLTLLPVLLGGGESAPLEVHKTPSGIRYGILGKKPAQPAPTLFVFAGGIEDSLQRADFNKIGQSLLGKGFVCVSVDIPCHGKDGQPNEPLGLQGWRSRLEKGPPLVGAFTARASTVLDHLIKEGYTDEKRVSAAGTSRGGFMALHLAAAEPRVGAVIAFAPVTDLRVVTEFAGLDKNQAIRDVNLVQHVDKLAGRHVWICIGNNDQRVGTDEVIDFTRRLVRATKGKSPVPVEIHVMPTLGHAIHATAHEEAARWLEEKTRGKR
jgi:dienelactone hydrolase